MCDPNQADILYLKYITKFFESEICFNLILKQPSLYL